MLKRIYGAGLASGAGVLLVVLEIRRPLRRSTRETKLRRNIRNLAIAAGAGLVMQFLERPLTSRWSRYVEAHRWGLAPMISDNRILQSVISIAMLDYGLYVWHVLTHRVPFLWRFHLVHHIDLDLDASTALRFHFGEMALSVPWRLMQIAVAGASPLSLSTWQTFLFCSILFHHSNVRLPLRAERVLSCIVMTPRLHGFHHESRLDHADSNWSSGLALWDLLHGTWRWADRSPSIGVPAYQNEDDITIGSSLTIPFQPQRNDWATSGRVNR